MEMTHAPHTQQPRHSRHRETVRRALGGTIEFRHFTGFDQLFAPHAHGYPVIGLVREGHRKTFGDWVKYLICPWIGIAILVYVFTGFQTATYIVGVCWLIIGLIIGAVKSKGYKEVPEAFKHLEV